MQSYQIFVNEKPLRLVKPQKMEHRRGRFVLHHKSADELVPWLEKLESDAQLTEVVAMCYNPAGIFDQLLQLLPVIDAAGGVVWQAGKVLFIYRYNRWDLPKGKVEPGEPADEAAMREVEEECGVTGLSIDGFINHTYHIYRFNRQLVVKRTHWYAMLCSHDGVLVPQQEEGITEVCWLAPHEWDQRVFPNTYASITELLQQVTKLT
jgi:8-oxo-dGTP pyrophosphatase MutT (NUDIX family)